MTEALDRPSLSEFIETQWGEECSGVLFGGCLWALAEPGVLHPEPNSNHFECWRQLSAADELLDVKFMCGLLPEHAEWWSRVRGTVRRLCETNEQVLAVGPCGLTEVTEETETQLQLQAFRGQLAMAAELELPVVVQLAVGTEQEAEEIMFEMLPQHSPILLSGFGGDSAVMLRMLDHFTQM